MLQLAVDCRVPGGCDDDYFSDLALVLIELPVQVCILRSTFLRSALITPPRERPDILQYLQYLLAFLGSPIQLVVALLLR